MLWCHRHIEGQSVIKSTSDQNKNKSSTALHLWIYFHLLDSMHRNPYKIHIKCFTNHGRWIKTLYNIRELTCISLLPLGLCSLCLCESSLTSHWLMIPGKWNWRRSIASGYRNLVTFFCIHGKTASSVYIIHVCVEMLKLIVCICSF